MSHNKNQITSLKNAYTNGDSTRYSDPEGPGQTGATLQLLKVGYPIGQYFTLSYAGKDANGVSQFYKRDGTKTSGSSPVSEQITGIWEMPSQNFYWAGTIISAIRILI
jgi:iron complex outermembrane receptor protein